MEYWTHWCSIWLKNNNDNGVVIELKTHAEGVALSVGVSGITIEME